MKLRKRTLLGEQHLRVDDVVTGDKPHEVDAGRHAGILLIPAVPDHAVVAGLDGTVDQPTDEPADGAAESG